MTVIEAVIQPKNGEKAKVIKWFKWEAAAQGIAGFTALEFIRTKHQPLAFFFHPTTPR